jgi:hypothetical protein
MTLWDQLMGIGKGLGAPNIGGGGKLKTLQGADTGLTTSGTYDAISCPSTSWTRVSSYTVKPQTQHAWGYGREGVEQANIGMFQFLPKTSAAGGTAIATLVRVAVVNSEDIVLKYVIHSVRSERLQKDLTDGKSYVFFLPEDSYKARQDDKLVIEIKPDTTATISGTASSLRVDTTIYI